MSFWTRCLVLTWTLLHVKLRKEQQMIFKTALAVTQLGKMIFCYLLIILMSLRSLLALSRVKILFLGSFRETTPWKRVCEWFLDLSTSECISRSDDNIKFQKWIFFDLNPFSSLLTQIICYTSPCSWLHTNCWTICHIYTSRYPIRSSFLATYPKLFTTILAFLILWWERESCNFRTHACKILTLLDFSWS